MLSNHARGAWTLAIQIIRGLGVRILPSGRKDCFLRSQRPENLAHARQSLSQRYSLDPPSGREVGRGFRVEHVASLDSALRNVLFARQATCQADSAATPPGNKSRPLVAAGRTETGHVARFIDWEHDTDTRSPLIACQHS